MIRLAPSIMCADFLNLERDIRALERARMDCFHIDIMDGHFVPNLAMNLDLTSLLKRASSIPLDVHLMVDNPQDYLEPLFRIGAEYISFHIETAKNPIRLLRDIRSSGAKAGVAVNPSTGLETLTYIYNEMDFILFMTVEPGFAGQKFIPAVLRKIESANGMIKTAGLNIAIHVDGNISAENALLCIGQGAEHLVLGSSGVFIKDVDLYEACMAFRQKISG